MHSLKKANKDLMAKVNLRQTSLSHVSQSYTSQLYQNAQVNQDMKVLLVLSKNTELFQRNWITKLEVKFNEREKKMKRLENKLQ